MAGDAKTLCSYCDSQHTQLDYALHRVSNNHVKKVQRKMVHRGFTSACLVCNCALKDLEQAELHVQEKTHTDRMKSFLVDSYLCNDKCTCGSCGIIFYNEVALEAHCLLSPSHHSTRSPKLDELSRLFSGLCAKQFAFACNRFCCICDASFPGVEDSIMHIFTASHISHLRSSSCMVCKKEFFHASDRELHIKSPKHHIALRKCKDILEKGQAHARLTKRGYPCMLCMIWCNSWFCLELHLLDKYHAQALVQSKAKCPISARIAFSAVSEGIGQSESCDQSTMNSWRRWRSDASEECVWCHRCGVLLSSIDEVDKHLNTHSVDRCLTLSRSHQYKRSDLASVSEIFSCSACALSFRNAFMLVAHEASLEHHGRLAVGCLTQDVQCCSNCGLFMNNEGDGNGSFGGSFPQTERAEVSPRSLGLCEQKSSSSVRANKTSVARVLDTIMQARSSAEGTHQNANVADKVFMETNSFLVPDERGDNLLKASTALGPRELPVSSGGKTARDEEGVDRASIENVFLMNDRFYTKYTCHDDHVRSQLGGAGLALNSENGHTCTSNVAGRNGIVAGKSITSTHEKGTNHSPSEVCLPNVEASSPLLDGQLQRTCAGLDNSIVGRNPLLLAGQIADGDGTEVAVPIVVAATFAPLGTLQESLQSITAIVTQSLSSALPAFYMQQSSPGLKRKNQAGVEEPTCSQQDAKRMCSQRILEAALRHGLQSVCPNEIVPNDVSVQCQGLTDEENVRLRRGDGGDVELPQAVIAVAASVIPNGLQDPYRQSGVQVKVEGSKAQGSSAVQSGDDSSKRAQESTEVKSESLSQVVVGDQGSAGSIRGKTVAGEKPNQPESSHMQPLLMPVSLANGALSSMKNEVFLPAKKLAAATRVVESGVSKESKSNDDDDDADDDYYAFLDPTKGQLKWWSSSDSEDSDSVRK